MIVKTFDEILTYLNDKLDEFIAAKSDGVKILRTNNNIFYLLQKADSKGYELIQASCAALDAKFDPTRCSDADLVSVGKIAGTERLKGKPTVLMITALNTNTVDTPIISGVEYPARCVYQYSADVWFEFIIPSMQTFAPNESRTYFAYSIKPDTQESLIGAYEVTAQTSISVMTDTDGDFVSSGFIFSNASTEGTLGYPEETPLAFRKRVLERTDREDTLKELETELNNLPTILSCTVFFNRSSSENVVVGGVVVPPYNMLLSVTGDVRDDFAQVVLQHGIFPTVDVGDTSVQTEDLSAYRGELRLSSENYTDGFLPVYYMRFIPIQYIVELTYTSDPALALDDTIQAVVASAFNTTYGNPTKHVPEITEDMFYTDSAALGIDSFKALNVTLMTYDEDWEEASDGYIAVPSSNLARMCAVKFVGANPANNKTVWFSITAAPEIAVAEGVVTITADEGTIYYTLDGSDPTEASSVYTEPITVAPDTIVRAAAKTPYKGMSAVVEAVVE